MWCDTIQPMKVYVAEYGLEELEKPEKKTEEDLYKPQVTLVRYSGGPEYTIGERDKAVWECQYLERAQVRVGEHCCAFTLEELPEGEFAIVCLSHPELASASKTA